MTPILEIALLVIAAVVTVALAVDLLGGRRRRRRERERLRRLRGEEDEDEQRLPERLSPLERRLHAAGLRFGTTTFLILLSVLGLVVFAGLLWLLPRALLAAVFAALVAIYVAFSVIVEVGLARGRRFERKLVDSVDNMVSALMAGEVPQRALASAAAVAEGEVETELKEVSRRLELGMSIQEALARMVRRYDSEGTRLFTQTLVVKWHAGGDLAPVLRSVAWIMRERIRLSMRLRTEMTGVQVAALAVAALPYVLLPFFAWRRPEWIQTLTEHPLGPPLLLAAIVLQIVGLLWLRRVVSIEL